MPEFQEEEIRKKIGDGSIQAISVDTAVFDTYGCNLEYPLLAKLDQFKAGGVRLLLSEVVVSEIRSHIARDAAETQRALKTALKKHNRRWRLDRDLAELWESFQIDVEASAAAQEQVDEYTDTVGAEVVPVAGRGDLSVEVFRRYFDVVTPFETKETKKHEFPDAFALLSLEQAAAEMETLILCVSPDKGWASFAAGSEHLIVVPKLDLALSWFNDPERIIAEKVVAVWKSGASDVVAEIDRAFEYYLDGLSFEAECTAPLYYEYEPIAAVMQDIYPDRIGDPIVIASEADQVTLTVKVVAKVDFEVRFDFYVHDHVDGDDVYMTGENVSHEKDVPFDVTMTVARQMDGNEIELIDVTVNSGSISVDFGHVEPFRDEGPEPDDWR